MDININEIVERLYLQNEEYPREQHFLLTGDRDFVLAGQWQALLEQEPESFKLNFKQQSLQDMLI